MFKKSTYRRKIEAKEAEQRWKFEKEALEIEARIAEEKNAFKNKKKKPSTSKALIFFLFANCTAIELFSCWATVRMLYIAAETGNMIDFTPLVALIGSIVGEAVSYAVYSIKSAKENSVNGITYELAMLDKQNNNNPLG